MSDLNKLNDGIELAKQYANSAISNILKLGEILATAIKPYYRLKYSSFEQALEENQVGISKRHADRIIKVYETFGTRVSQNLSFRKLYLLTQVEDEHLDEYVEIAKEPKMTAQKLEKKIKRSLPNVGDESYYAKNLDTKDKEEDRKLKLIRHAKELESEFKSFLAIKEDLRLKANNWLNNAVNLPDLAEAVKEIKEQLRCLD